MPFSGGIFTPLYNWEADAAAGIDILATKMDNQDSDIAAGLSNAILRDGSGAPTADIPFAGHSLTGIRAAAANGEPVEFSQFQSAGQVTNLLHNAAFPVNQRGVSGTVTLAAGVYGHDRWKAGSAGSVYTFAKSGQDTTITISSGTLLQIVSGDDIGAGTYTLQNDGTAQGRLYQGTPSGFAGCPLQATLAAGTATVAEFATGTILRPQIVAGSLAKSFGRRSAGLEMPLCTQYYYAQNVHINTSSTVNAPTTYDFFFPAPMLATVSSSNIDLTGITTKSPSGITVGGVSQTGWYASGITGGSGWAFVGKWAVSVEP